MEYQKKLNEAKGYYPFKRWREAFDNGLEQYTEENCKKAQDIFDTLIAELIAQGENSTESQKIELFRKAIVATNKLNDECDGSLIETGEREDLCELTDIITRACNLDPSKYGGGEGLATEWRDW